MSDTDTMFEEQPVHLTKEQFQELQDIASEFNLTIQAAFLEMMDKMKMVEIDHPGGNIIKGNYAPLALGAAIAAIIERYDPSCEREFFALMMSKYKEAREALAGILEAEGEEKDGVTTIEMEPSVIPHNMSKMKH